MRKNTNCSHSALAEGMKQTVEFFVGKADERRLRLCG